MNASANGPKRRRRNDVLLPFRVEIRGEAKESLQQVADVSDHVAERILEAYPDGRGLNEATVIGLQDLGATKRQAERIVSAFRLRRACDAACQATAERKEIGTAQDVVALLRSSIGFASKGRVVPKREKLPTA